MENTKNKYYQEKEIEVNELISKSEFEQALKIINEELSMPYIPMKFEEYLMGAMERIPISHRSQESYSLSLDKIIDLLLKLDKSNNDVRDLISQVSKFNLDNEKDELEYFFNKSTNTRNRSMMFELLIKMKVDIECQLGNPSKSISIIELTKYQNDLKEIKEKLEANYPEMIYVCEDLLQEIYLTIHAGQKLEGGFADLVIYTTGKIFEREDILNLVTDLNAVHEKMNTFKTFDNF